jgi:hypothetical protein
LGYPLGQVSKIFWELARGRVRKNIAIHNQYGFIGKRGLYNENLKKLNQWLLG